MNNFYGRRISLSPAEVNFTQDSVAMCFQNENEINVTLEEIAKGSLSVSSFPSIRVLVIDGDYYSVDNRRLYVFRVLNLLGLLQSIQVKKVDSFERELTTENEGCHVWVRNRKDNNGRWLKVDTYRHCSCNRGRNARLPDWWNSNLNCHVSLVNVRVRRPISHSSRLESPSSGIRAQQASRQSSIKSVSQQVAHSSRPKEDKTISTSSYASVVASGFYATETDHSAQAHHSAHSAQAEPNQYRPYQSLKKSVVKPNATVDRVTNKQFSNKPAVYQASQSMYATGSTNYAMNYDETFKRRASQTPSNFASQSAIDFFDYPKHKKPKLNSHTPASNSITAVPDTLVITAPRSEPSPWNQNHSANTRLTEGNDWNDSTAEGNCFTNLLKTIFCCVSC